jgi:hypothetical protein
MILLYSIFFIVLNYLVYKLIRKNDEFRHQFLLVIIFFFSIAIVVKIYNFFYVKSFMIHGFPLAILLLFSFGIAIFNLMNKFINTRLNSRLEENNMSDFIFDDESPMNVISVLSVIITFMQILFLCNQGFLNLRP